MICGGTFCRYDRFFDQTRTLPEFDAWQSDLICEEDWIRVCVCAECWQAFGEFSPCLQLCHEARISTCHLSQAGECIWKGETKIVNPLILYFKENGTVA